MEIRQPAPLRSKYNDFATDIDYSMTNPLNQAGSDFSCKGYHKLVGSSQGQSTATYTPGQSYTMIITGGAHHSGGSCQISLSYDTGSTWTAIHSYIGNCPVSAGETSYDFAIPGDAPSGEAFFGWTWFNKVGNREMYMNCAVVTISADDKAESQDSFDSRPTEGSDVDFPFPGPDATRNGDAAAPPAGSCAGVEKAPMRA